MYADKITNSMKKTIDQTNYRRDKQINYNIKNNLTPKAITKSLENPLEKNLNTDDIESLDLKKNLKTKIKYFNKEQLDKEIKKIRKEMEIAAIDLNFIKAANLRDILSELVKRKKNGA